MAQISTLRVSSRQFHVDPGETEAGKEIRIAHGNNLAWCCWRSALKDLGNPHAKGSLVNWVFFANPATGRG